MQNDSIAHQKDNRDLKKFFESIVSEYSPMLYAHIRTIVIQHDQADDVLQETWIKVWFALPAFRSESTISTWLYRVATNEALQYLRKQKWKKLFSIKKEDIRDGRKVFQYESDPVKELEQAIKHLTIHQRKIFGMRYFNNTPFAEIAKVLGLAEGTVKSTYHQCVKKIEDQLVKNIR